MIESSLYTPATNPDKALPAPGSPYDLPVQSTKENMYLTWMVPTSFLVVEPKLSLYWLNLEEECVDVEWTIKYRYYNQESYLGYFNGLGLPIINYDDGVSELYTATLRTTNPAEKNIIQKTTPYRFIKKERQTGTLVLMEIQAKPHIAGVYFMGSEIRYTEEDRPREPRGRKRTYKEKYDEDNYYDPEYDT